MFRLIFAKTKQLLLITTIALIGCGPSGPVKHKVTGTVLVNDKPVSGVTVCLRHLNDSVKGKYRIPIAVTDNKGNFLLSTDETGDGVVEGEYVVTFVWMLSDNDNDRFEGRYSNTNTSQFRLKVPVPDGKAEPFRLQFEFE